MISLKAIQTTEEFYPPQINTKVTSEEPFEESSSSNDFSVTWAFAFYKTSGVVAGLFLLKQTFEVVAKDQLKNIAYYTTGKVKQEITNFKFLIVSTQKPVLVKKNF
jgi:hypothetical protein